MQFSTTINQTALVAGTAITGMVVKTQNKLNSSRPSLPEGVYLKSFEPTTVSTTTPSNLRKLTIAHDTKSATEIISSIQSGDTLSFSVPYGYNLSFIHLDGVMTDSNGTEIVSTKSIVNGDTSSSAEVDLAEANTDIATGMRVSSNTIADIDNITVSSIATNSTSGEMTLTLSSSVSLKDGEELTLFTDSASSTVGSGQTYVVSGNVQINKFGTASLTSKFLFDDFVKSVALSNYAVKNTYAKGELNFVIDPIKSLYSGQGKLTTKFPTISISQEAGGILNQPYILYVGKGKDNSGDGIPDTNSSSTDDILTDDDTELDFVLQVVFPKDPTHKNFYNLSITALPNQLFDNFNAGDEGGSAGVYKRSDIREFMIGPPGSVSTVNVFEFDFSCKVNKTGGLSVNQNNLSISFQIVMSTTARLVHPRVGPGAITPTETEEEDTSAFPTDFITRRRAQQNHMYGTDLD